VDHLDEVARATFADPVAAGLAGGGLGADGLEDLLHQRPGGRAATGHHRGAAAGAFLTAAHAGADVKQALAFQILGAADGVWKMRVAAVDDQVACFEVGQQQFDEVVHGLAGLHHEHDLTGPFQQGRQFLDRMGAEDGFASRGGSFQELVYLGNRTVEGYHRVALVIHVQDEVLAHHGQTNQSDVALRLHDFLLALPGGTPPRRSTGSGVIGSYV